jgi:hypothetical protein
MVFGLGAVRDFLSDNAVTVDAAPEEAKLNQTMPNFLKPGERRREREFSSGGTL